MNIDRAVLARLADLEAAETRALLLGMPSAVPSDVPPIIVACVDVGPSYTIPGDIDTIIPSGLEVGAVYGSVSSASAILNKFPNVKYLVTIIGHGYMCYTLPDMLQLPVNAVDARQDILLLCPAVNITVHMFPSREDSVDLEQQLMESLRSAKIALPSGLVACSSGPNDRPCRTVAALLRGNGETDSVLSELVETDMSLLRTVAKSNWKLASLKVLIPARDIYILSSQLKIPMQVSVTLNEAIAVIPEICLEIALVNEAISGLEKQFHAALRSIFRDTNTNAAGVVNYCKYESAIFIPTDYGPPVKMFFRADWLISEPMYIERRRQMHYILGLPLGKPLFKRSCAIQLHAEEGSVQKEAIGVPLRDVHLSIVSNSNIRGGRLHLVQGPYEYYHYNHHKTKDSGWGCAYRSIQTIVSWFILNHYFEGDIPMHKDIQRVLVAIGDKQPSFVGSEEWIGSTEVGFYLNERFGIEWKNIMVPNINCLPSKSGEISKHFEEYGSPIMLGGGSMAFTILGICWNETSNEVSYLVLDPHYTGDDDMKYILDRRRLRVQGVNKFSAPCGWRTVDDFEQNVFFNLCLPLCPIDSS